MKILRFAEKILPLFFWLLLIFAFDTPALAFMTLFSAVIHELGHISAGLSRGMLRLFPQPTNNGFRIKTDGLISYKDDLILTLGGPLFNIITAICSWLIALHGVAYFRDFSLINLLTAVSNLLPIKEYDGYRIIESSALLLFKKTEGVLRILNAFSFAFTVLLMFLALYFILKSGEGYWIFAVFFSSFIVETAKISKNNKL